MLEDHDPHPLRLPGNLLRHLEQVLGQARVQLGEPAVASDSKRGDLPDQDLEGRQHASGLPVLPVGGRSAALHFGVKQAVARVEVGEALAAELGVDDAHRLQGPELHLPAALVLDDHAVAAEPRQEVPALGVVALVPGGQEQSVAQVPALPAVVSPRHIRSGVDAVAPAAQVGAHVHRMPDLSFAVPPLDPDRLVPHRLQPLEPPHGLDGAVDDLSGPAAPAAGLGGGVGQGQHPDAAPVQLHELAAVEVREGAVVGEGVPRQDAGFQPGIGLQARLQRQALQPHRWHRLRVLEQGRLHQLRQAQLLHHHIGHRGARRRLEALRLQGRGQLEARRAQHLQHPFGRPALVGPEEEHVHRQRGQQAQQHAAVAEGADHRRSSQSPAGVRGHARKPRPSGAGPWRLV